MFFFVFSEHSLTCCHSPMWSLPAFQNNCASSLLFNNTAHKKSSLSGLLKSGIHFGLLCFVRDRDQPEMWTGKVTKADSHATSVDSLFGCDARSSIDMHAPNFPHIPQQRKRERLLSVPFNVPDMSAVLFSFGLCPSVTSNFLSERQTQHTCSA